ncbi:heme exporter protein CcmB, partial [Escherichia coli]|nr:heme exporter protein CcmB [Escherichia coli]
LLCILVLPLCVPVLVFGAGAGSAADAGLDVMPHLSLLGACLALSLFVCPLATAAGLRIAAE